MLVKDSTLPSSKRKKGKKKGQVSEAAVASVGTAGLFMTAKLNQGWLCTSLHRFSLYRPILINPKGVIWLKTNHFEIKYSKINYLEPSKGPQGSYLCYLHNLYIEDRRLMEIHTHTYI